MLHLLFLLVSLPSYLLNRSPLRGALFAPTPRDPSGLHRRAATCTLPRTPCPDGFGCCLDTSACSLASDRLLDTGECNGSGSGQPSAGGPLASAGPTPPGTTASTTTEGGTTPTLLTFAPSTVAPGTTTPTLAVSNPGTPTTTTAAAATTTMATMALTLAISSPGTTSLQTATTLMQSPSDPTQEAKTSHVTSATPDPTATASSDGGSAGWSQSDRIGLGVGIGIGVPTLIAAIVAIVVACRGNSRLINALRGKTHEDEGQARKD